jgi:phenylacetate-CoA ligase
MTIRPSPSIEAEPRPRPLVYRVVGSARIAWSMRDARSFARRSAEATRAAQERRLRSVVEHAYRTVPFYGDTMRRLGITPEDIQTTEELARLPIVERTAIQRDPERFLSRARPTSDYLALRSGGSSGAPRVVYHDPASALENTGHGERHRTVLRRLTGRWGFRVLAIGSPRGADVEIRAFVRRHALVPGIAVAARAMRTMAERPEDIARDLATIRPDVVLSMPTGERFLRARRARS